MNRRNESLTRALIDTAATDRCASVSTWLTGPSHVGKSFLSTKQVPTHALVRPSSRARYAMKHAVHAILTGVESDEWIAKFDQALAQVSGATSVLVRWEDAR